ncbi:MAG TPA: two-component regulator propeller domain-containing protein, partial [Flavisolibacter sp.]|nr:two-component regulator propeller domain-containing protein [Flavisolibacter sp.]
MRFKIYVLLLLCCLWKHGLAQLGHLRFAHYGDRNGLSDRHCNSIVQDSQGYVWVGTLDGLNRFDGNQFRSFRSSAADPFSISSAEAQPLHTTRDGKVWINTNKGINWYDPKTGKFTLAWPDEAKGRTPVTAGWVMED